MPVKVTWTGEAREDLLGIYVLIGLEQPAAAERYYDRVRLSSPILSHIQHVQASLGRC